MRTNEFHRIAVNAELCRMEAAAAARQGITVEEYVQRIRDKMKQDYEQYDGGMTAEELQREVDARRFNVLPRGEHTSELAGETAAGRDLKFGEIQPKPFWFDLGMKRCKCCLAGSTQVCSHQTRGDDHYIGWQCNQCGTQFCTFLEG